MLRHRAHFALEECRSARRSRYCGQGDQVSVQPFVAAQIDNHSEDRFAPGQLQSLAGQEHGRTIPLADVASGRCENCQQR